MSDLVEDHQMGTKSTALFLFILLQPFIHEWLKEHCTLLLFTKMKLHIKCTINSYFVAYSNHRPEWSGSDITLPVYAFEMSVTVQQWAFIGYSSFDTKGCILLLKLNLKIKKSPVCGCCFLQPTAKWTLTYFYHIKWWSCYCFNSNSSKKHTMWLPHT